ncbi:hypothetical protein L226DRAFT_524944 [Lentinus tigrinus ALCF2SS1-7]|uniref:Uncharacterized protein n=1 Tax=Lentinus tigrinus ALCF2SS1-6 TaxID=1328759 RepID=A0A5C2S3I8_9APHY|nr:hypothetical protein L227DRAFT_613720 [Lentinus tigrinus ALCF2SS1-6]RPD72077.1 hypothetical protein L226DRAFT_524944 [Lentinus tigrinus ALCF2SS1-7]
MDWTKFAPHPEVKKEYENIGVEKAKLETRQTSRREKGSSARMPKPAQSRTAAVRTPLGPCTNTLSQPAVTPTTEPVTSTHSGLLVKCKPEPDVEFPMRLVHTHPADDIPGYNSHRRYELPLPILEAPLCDPYISSVHSNYTVTTRRTTHVPRAPLPAFDPRLNQFATDLDDALQASAQLDAQPPRTFKELKMWCGAQTDSLEFLNRIQTGVY